MTTPKTGKLVIVRHHESEWNKLGKWTGTHEANLTEYGHEKAGEMGTAIKDICFDVAYTSAQIRTKQTFASMLKTCTVDEKLHIIHAPELNERDYGDYTGKNKWEIEKQVGEKEFKAIRRGWDHNIPGGESLKMVYDRAVPYFLSEILPKVLAGKNVLIVAHGNSLRSIMKYVEKISDEGIADTEISLGTLIMYDVDKDGRMTHKEIRTVESKSNA